MPTEGDLRMLETTSRNTPDQRARAVWHTARWCANRQLDADALKVLLDQLGLDAAEAKGQ